MVLITIHAVPERSYSLGLLKTRTIMEFLRVRLLGVSFDLHYKRINQGLQDEYRRT
jgi:hypothetical protein